MPIATDRDKLRLTIGDTDSDNQLFQDDELDYFLSLEPGDILLAGAAAAEAAAAKFARAFDFDTDQQSFKRSTQHKAFLDLASRLRTRAAGLVVGEGGATIGTTTTAVTKRVDGYSQDIDNEDVRQTDINRRQSFYVVDGLDEIP